MTRPAALVVERLDGPQPLYNVSELSAPGTTVWIARVGLTPIGHFATVRGFLSIEENARLDAVATQIIAQPRTAVRVAAATHADAEHGTAPTATIPEVFPR